jgi:hypothetical protein
LGIFEACMFNLSEIGELVNKLDEEYIAKHSNIPWFKMVLAAVYVWTDYCAGVIRDLSLLQGVKMDETRNRNQVGFINRCYGIIKTQGLGF